MKDEDRQSERVAITPTEAYCWSVPIYKIPTVEF